MPQSPKDDSQNVCADHSLQLLPYFIMFVLCVRYTWLIEVNTIHFQFTSEAEIVKNRDVSSKILNVEKVVISKKGFYCLQLCIIVEDHELKG